MRILFDGILLQTFTGGAAAYTYKVLCTLFEEIEQKKISAEIYLLHNPNKKFVKDYSLDTFLKCGLKMVDMPSDFAIAQVVSEYKIDSFFIGCGQYWAKCNFENVNCHAVVVIHDLYDCELNANKLFELVFDDNLSTWKNYVKAAYFQLIKVLGKRTNYLHFDYDNLLKFYNNIHTEAVTVSEYSKSALRYFFPQIKQNIHVLYSPHKVVNFNVEIDSDAVKQVIESKKKYYLMVSCNRWPKNARFVIDTFLNMHKDNTYLVTVGYPKSIGKDHIVVPFVSESDLAHLYKNAYTLIYPSIEEGFGYPPIEAMRFGVPVLASYVCSIPEVCGDAALYFSPFHHNSLCMKINELDEHYEQYVEKSRQRYSFIKQRQNSDLAHLIQLILMQH